VPLDAEKRHDLAAMKKAITSETKLVVVTNPNNPTGTLLSHDEIESFINDVPETVKVLVDEAYIDFTRDPHYKTATDLAISRPNVLVTRTFSKVYGLPAIRMGYAVSKWANFEGFWNYTGSWNALSLVAAEAALSDTAHIQNTKNVVHEGRLYLEKELSAMGVEYIPSDSSFMIFKVKDANKIGGALAKRKVFVRNAERMWGVKNHIRVSIGTKDECEAFMTMLQEVMAAGV
jgi:histidinol-phosphate aminotransferase